MSGTSWCQYPGGPVASCLESTYRRRYSGAIVDNKLSLGIFPWKVIRYCNVRLILKSPLKFGDWRFFVKNFIGSGGSYIAWGKAKKKVFKMMKTLKCSKSYLVQTWKVAELQMYFCSNIVTLSYAKVTFVWWCLWLKIPTFLETPIIFLAWNPLSRQQVKTKSLQTWTQSWRYAGLRILFDAVLKAKSWC